MSVALGILARGLCTLGDADQAVTISGLTADSREVGKGMLFAALSGTRTDGARYAEEAVRRGAVAVLAAHDAELGSAAGGGVAVLRADNPRLVLAQMAARMYGPQPDIIVAVTGTNGKTSVVSFVRQIWSVLGLHAASMGTVGTVSPTGARPLAHTTPDPVALHKCLGELSGEHVEHVAIEASSHGLAQFRLHGLRLTAAGFTNLTRDHLDYHADFASYLGAKMRLFEDVLGEGAVVVIDADFADSADIVERCKARRLVVWTTGASGDTLKLKSTQISGFGQRLVIEGREGVYDIYLPLVGAFQASNALMAAGLVMAAGGSEPHAIRSLEQLHGATGRLELVATTAADAPVFVDYAHTPDALAHALRSLRPYARGRLHVVFGAGGDRDPGKRPEMGAAAAEHADVVIVTDDNPRSEDPGAIRLQILAACPGAKEIGDRAEAIQTAIEALREGDVLVIAGKGHETGQTVGGKVIPFSDHEAVLACLGGKVANG